MKKFIVVLIMSIFILSSCGECLDEEPCEVLDETDIPSIPPGPNPRIDPIDVPDIPID